VRAEGCDSLPLLDSRDVAAAGRWAVSTVETWRQRRPDHPLKWIDLPGGQKRTTVGSLKAFLASGKPRKRPGPSPRAAPSEPPPPASPRQLKQRKPEVARKPAQRRADRADAALQEQT